VPHASTCHFQKSTALADPGIRLDRTRMQSSFDPAPVRKWAALSSVWVRTRLHQGSDRPKARDRSRALRDLLRFGRGGGLGPGGCHMSRSVTLCRTQETQPAQVKSGGKLEPTRRPRRETRVARSKLHCLKPNPERMINGPAATSVRRRRVSGADRKRLTAGKTARYSDRGDEPGSRDELAT